MIHYPRVDIQFCTKCRWNLRAAWYLQELLSTFGNDLGEVALAPADAGVFQVYVQPSAGIPAILLWDRKQRGGFPDSKDLKQLVRDVIDPAKSLGHSDRKPPLSGAEAAQDGPSGPAAGAESASPRPQHAPTKLASTLTLEGQPTRGTDNRGTDNHGEGNDGNHNHGNYNVGNNNHGDNNHGNNNVGNGNHGNNNRGNDNTGDNNHGNSNHGNNNNGNNNIGNNHNGDNHGHAAGEARRSAAAPASDWTEECVDCNAL